MRKQLWKKLKRNCGNMTFRTQEEKSFQRKKFPTQTKETRYFKDSGSATRVTSILVAEKIGTNVVKRNNSEQTYSVKK